MTSSTIDNFFEITKFSKILSKLTFYFNMTKNFEKRVNFESIYDNFVISKKSVMVDEVNIRVVLRQIRDPILKNSSKLLRLLFSGKLS